VSVVVVDDDGLLALVAYRLVAERGQAARLAEQPYLP